MTLGQGHVVYQLCTFCVPNCPHKPPWAHPHQRFYFQAPASFPNSGMVLNNIIPSPFRGTGLSAEARGHNPPTHPRKINLHHVLHYGRQLMRYLPSCGFRSAVTCPGQVVEYWSSNGPKSRQPSTYPAGFSRFNVSPTQSSTLHRIFDICQQHPDRPSS